jgi:hypothetical protein
LVNWNHRDSTNPSMTLRQHHQRKLLLIALIIMISYVPCPDC